MGNDSKHLSVVNNHLWGTTLSQAGCGKAAEILALEINFSVLSCHSQSLDMGWSSVQNTSLWKVDLHAACCTVEHNPFPWNCSTHQKVLLPAQQGISREASSGHSNTASFICNRECKKRSQKQESYLSWFETNLGVTHGKSRIPGHSPPFKYLTMALAQQEKLWKVLFHSTQKKTKQMDYRTVKYLATVLLTSTCLCPTTQILWGQSVR